MVDEEIRTWAEIDLARLEANYNEIRRSLPAGCEVAGVCKANAYGHGAVTVAARLQELGAGYIAVSCFSEAQELRRAGIKAKILILAPSPAKLAGDIAELGCEQAVGSMDMARAMSAAMAGTRRSLLCHMKLETGMGRTGFSALGERELAEAAGALALPGLGFTGVFTHFACSDEPGSGFTMLQYGRFLSALGCLRAAAGRELGVRHAANSGAVINFPQTALDMVRPGLLLYGLYPGAERGGLSLKPVMSVKTRVAALTRHSAGDTISYGRSFTCARDTLLAVIPVGYADGLPRRLSGKFSVSVRGQRARQVGAVCMDMCMLDVTDIPGVRVGDVVSVFGDEPPADELAAAAGTISYELLCAVSPRVPRVYINE